MAGKRRNLSFHEMTQPNPKQPKYSEKFFLYAFERNSYRCMNQIPLTDISAAGITSTVTSRPFWMSVISP